MICDAEDETPNEHSTVTVTVPHHRNINSGVELKRRDFVLISPQTGDHRRHLSWHKLSTRSCRGSMEIQTVMERAKL